MRIKVCRQDTVLTILYCCIYILYVTCLRDFCSDILRSFYMDSNCANQVSVLCSLERRARAYAKPGAARGSCDVKLNSHILLFVGWNS